jgi:hypothetical protein
MIACRIVLRSILAAAVVGGWTAAAPAARAQCAPGENCAPEQQPDIDWMNTPLTAIDGLFPTPWACNNPANGNVPDPGVQSVLAFHHNWHCANPDNSGANWGSRFLGFHKQLLRGYERFSAAGGFPNIQTFTPSNGAIIPPAHNGRPANSPCTGVDGGGNPANCQQVPAAFRTPAAGGTLDSFATENALGDAVVTYHNNQHTRLGFASTAAGGFGECGAGTFRPDIQCPRFAPRDPVFYRYHNLYNDIQDAWRTFQPADVMIVFDRSGSMSLPTSAGPTRLQAAKDAANMFADLLDNAGTSRVGLVSFSSAAAPAPELALTLPAAAPGAMSAAVGPIAAGGMTSIGAGLAAAQAALAGSARPSILLLTDGMENTAPMIADIATGAPWVPMHLCAVGFGTPGSLDGPKMRDLAERQGGIYVSGPEPLQLRKFFVDCFADIFDTFMGMDPIQVLEPGDAASAPLTHTALGDRKLAFVLSWSEAVAPGEVRLRITSPSGRVVQATDPGVESEMDALWHVVRFPLPLAGEQDGPWQAQAVRGPRSYANGFTGNAFADFDAGVELIRRQLRELCPGGCRRVLYYEDEMPMGAGMDFGEMNSAYAAALYYEVPLGTVGEVTRLRDPQEFAVLLRRGGFDLIVYASKAAREQEPYDGLLVERLCAPDGPPAIVSDSRQSEAALAIWGCVGVKPTGETDWDAIIADGVLVDQDLKLAPLMPHGPFSFGLAPAEDRATTVVGNSVGSGAIVQAVRAAPPRQELFIDALTDSAARVVPHPYRSVWYTGERLHPTFQIPEAYWPAEGFDSVKAVVRVTRPLRGLGELAMLAGRGEGRPIDGDAVDPRTAALIAVDPKQTGEVIGSETLEFPLYDDGTNGDGVPGDRYWEAELPPEIAAADGEYEFHAIFQLCRGDVCVPREARHKAVVDVKIDPKGSEVIVTPSPDRGRTEILFTPRDRNGRPVGPGLASRFLIEGRGGARVVGVTDSDKPGTYRIDVATQPEAKQRAWVRIAQYGRPKNALLVPLSR